MWNTFLTKGRPTDVLSFFSGGFFFPGTTHINLRLNISSFHKNHYRVFCAPLFALSFEHSALLSSSLLLDSLSVYIVYISWTCTVAHSVVLSNALLLLRLFLLFYLLLNLPPRRYFSVCLFFFLLRLRSLFLLFNIVISTQETVFSFPFPYFVVIWFCSSLNILFMGLNSCFSPIHHYLSIIYFMFLLHCCIYRGLHGLITWNGEYTLLYYYRSSPFFFPIIDLFCFFFLTSTAFLF